MTITHTRSLAWVGPRLTHRRDPGTGAAAVEFALVLPIFMLLVLGALDYGYYFFSAQVVVGAAREGARAGAATQDTTQVSLATNTAKSFAYQYMKGHGVDCPSGTDSCISPVGTTTVDVGGTPVRALQVHIEYDFRSPTGYLSTSIIPGKISATAIMRW